MSVSELRRLRELFAREDILISFSGPFTHTIIEELGRAVRAYLENEQIRKTMVMDVFSVVIEQTQNVRNYTEQLPEADRQAVVVIGRKGPHYVVSSGNLIRHGDVAPLEQRLTHINDLDASDLRRHYKSQLRQPSGEGRGAGLGLVDMARKASEPLEYAMEPVDERFSFFSLRVVI